MTLLVTRGLACGYSAKALVRVDDLSVAPGEAQVLLGPNGAGKSTLLKTLCGALRPVEGRVEIDGADLCRLSPAKRARRVTMLMQVQPLDPGATVEEVVRLGRTPHLGRWGRLSRTDLEAVDEAIAVCRLTEMRRRRLGEMSGGERQRARLAMVLAQGTEVVLLDEPTTHLDIEHRYMLHQILERVREERACAVLMVSHSLEDARRFADRVILVKGGATRFFGPGEHEALLSAITMGSDVPAPWVY